MSKVSLKDYIIESMSKMDLLTGSKNEKKEKCNAASGIFGQQDI